MNCITDVAGVRVGHAEDADLISGVTVTLFDQPNVAAAVVGGGAPGTRGVSILAPETINQGVDAIVLSGGSAFGLDAAGGVMDVLRARKIGFPVGSVRVPIVAQAITFDLLNGGAAAPEGEPVYWSLGAAAARAAKPEVVSLGSVGGGIGATTATFKGGVGSASTRVRGKIRVGALAVVNAIGSATVGDGPHFWAGAFEQDAEFGGHGPAGAIDADALRLRLKGGDAPPPSTTIAIVVTDAALDKSETRRLALMANDGLALAIRPAHAPMDGDTVFAVSRQLQPLEASGATLTEIGSAASDCLARAVGRAVFLATNPGGGYTGPPAYHDVHGPRASHAPGGDRNDDD